MDESQRQIEKCKITARYIKVHLLILLQNFIKYKIMIDQEWQAKKPISGNWNDYHILIQIISSDYSFQIVVEDVHTHDKFKKIINKHFISLQEQFFKTFFEEPSDLFETLAQCFQNIIIEEDCLKFEYVYGAKKRSKTIVIKLQKQISQLAKLKAQNQQLKEEFQKFREKANQQIKLAIYQVENLQKNLKQQIFNKQKLQLLLKQIKVQKQGLEKNAKEMTKAFQESQTKLQISSSRCKQLQVQILALNQKVKQLEQEEQESEQQVVQLHRYCHPDNPHNQFYDLCDLEGSGVRLMHTGDSGVQYNFVEKLRIRPKKSITFWVRLVKVKENCLSVGFCTEKGLGVIRNYQQKQSVYYMCKRPGATWLNGSKRDIDNYSCCSETIVCNADLINNHFTFSKNEQIIAHIKVPKNMRGKILYLSVALKYNGDMVDIILVK